MSPGAWADARRLLAVRLDALGDVLMTTPAIRALRASAPGGHITLLTSPAGAALHGLVDVDDVIVYEAPWMKATPPRAEAEDHAMIRRIAGGRFDAAVIFTVYSQNPLPAALLCFLAGVPRRLAHCRENPYQLLTDWVQDPEPERTIRHEVRRQLDLVATVGCRTADEGLALLVPAAARRRADAVLHELGLRPGRGWFIVHPGASALSRRYPAAAFAEVARRLADITGSRVVVTGSTEEAPLAAEVQRAVGARARTLAGRLDLPTLAALIERAPLLVSNNTAPVHIAAAVGTPVVDLYALTNPQHTPWHVAHRVLFHDVPCKYCYKSVCPLGHQDCLRQVAPDAVVGAALELLGQDAGPLPSSTSTASERASRP